MLLIPLKKLLATLRLAAFLPLTLLLLAPASATATDTYEAAWNGGNVTATANPDFTEATIESVSFSFDQCGTATGETSCSWEAALTLHSDSDSRCNPLTPEDQVVWSSGAQTGNGSVTDSSKSFPLEGCRGQSLSMRIEFHKTYDGTAGPLVITGGASGGPLFTFGYHPVEEAEQRIIDANTAPNPGYPPFEPNFSPAKTFGLSPNCKALTLNSTRYTFAFHRMGCHKASNLARSAYLSGHAPRGYACRRRAGGMLCRRQGQPQKYFEWRRPGTKPARG
jgi:hypothetical protein